MTSEEIARQAHRDAQRSNWIAMWPWPSAPSNNRVPIVKTCEGRQSLDAYQLTGVCRREDQHNEHASHHAL